MTTWCVSLLPFWSSFLPLLSLQSPAMLHYCQCLTVSRYYVISRQKQLHFSLNLMTILKFQNQYSSLVSTETWMCRPSADILEYSYFISYSWHKHLHTSSRCSTADVWACTKNNRCGCFNGHLLDTHTHIHLIPSHCSFVALPIKDPPTAQTLFFSNSFLSLRWQAGGFPCSLSLPTSLSHPVCLSIMLAYSKHFSHT